MEKRIVKKSTLMREGYIKGLKKALRILTEMADGFEDSPTTDMYDRISKIMSRYKEMYGWKIREAKDASARIAMYDEDYKCYTASVYFSKMYGKNAVRISSDGIPFSMQELQCIMEIAQLF